MLCISFFVLMVIHSIHILLRGLWGPRRKYINVVKPNAMGKIQLAHELAWNLCKILGRSGNQVKHVYLIRDRESMPWAHVKVQRSWYMYCKDVGKQYGDKIFLLKTWPAIDINCQYHEFSFYVMQRHTSFKQYKARCVVFSLNFFSRRGLCISELCDYKSFGSQEKKGYKKFVIKELNFVNIYLYGTQNQFAIYVNSLYPNSL